MNEFYMEETDDMENELDNFDLYLDQELDYLDEEDEWSEDEIWEDAGEEDELTEAEEIELVKALTSIIDAAEAILVGMQRKVFELNETQDIEMRNDIVELEDGEKHLIVSAFLPDRENPDYGYYVPMKSEKIEQAKNESAKKRLRSWPKFMKYTRDTYYARNGKYKSAEDMRKERKNRNDRIDESLICPMNALVDIIDEYEHTKLTKKAMFGNKPEIPTEEFLAKVEGRADSRQINKVLEWAKEWKDAAQKHKLTGKDNLGAYVNLLEKQEQIKTDMKRSIRKMDRKTMSQMIRFAIKAGDNIGIPSELRENYRKFGMEVMQLCYDYNKKMFLSCFKTSAEMKEEKARAEQQSEKVTKFPKKVRRSMKKTRRKAI